MGQEHSNQYKNNELKEIARSLENKSKKSLLRGFV